MTLYCGSFLLHVEHGITLVTDEFKLYRVLLPVAGNYVHFFFESDVLFGLCHFKHVKSHRVEVKAKHCYSQLE